jgi:hypothetical protein
MAWTPYEFHIYGVLDHVGSDIWGFTANNSTEGATKKYPIWDVFKELPITRPILNGFSWK